MDAASPTKTLGIALAGAVAAVVGLAAVAWAEPPGSLDDLFVVLADARAWLGGDERSGPLPRPEVESSTSPLDVGAKALTLIACGSGDAVRATGWIQLILVALLAFLAAAAAGGSATHRALFACGVVLAPGVAEAAAFRLEGPLFAVLWIACVDAVLRGRARATLALSLGAMLARPEGMLLAPLACWLAAGSDRRRAARFALGALALGGLITAVRLALFGDPLPNTFYAKSAESRLLELQDGLQYLGAALAGSPEGLGLTLLAAVSTGLVVMRRGATGVEPARRALVLAAAAAVIVVVSGGDAYAGARLVLPVGIPVWLAAARLRPLAGRVVLPAAAASLALQLVGALPAAHAATAFERLRLAVVGGPIGLDAFEGDERVFDAVAAALGTETLAHRHLQRFRWFEPSAEILDLTGLTDREVARRPTPGPVRFGRDAVDLALDRRVGAIHLDPLRARSGALAEVDLVAALSDPAVAPRYGGPPYLPLDLARSLADVYCAASLPHPDAGGSFNLLVRRDLAERFEAQGFAVARRD
ncbi:MAG: hypothetical protein AAGA20_17240 [Planctomycetota bacterium]